MDYFAELAKRKLKQARAALYESGEMSIVIAPAQQSLPDTCPKCGKELGRGKVLHLKHCQGAK